MNWLKDLVSPAILLFLANLESLIVVIAVSVLIWLFYEGHRQHKERERQLQLRLTQELKLRLRQRRRRQPQIDYINQQEPTSSSSEQPTLNSAVCENCHKFFRLRRSELPQSAFSHNKIAHCETLSVVCQNAMKGCPVCALISRKLKDRPVAADKPVTFTIEPQWSGWCLFSPHLDIWVTPVTDERSKNTPLSIFMIEPNL